MIFTVYYNVIIFIIYDAWTIVISVVGISPIFSFCSRLYFWLQIYSDLNTYYVSDASILTTKKQRKWTRYISSWIAMHRYASLTPPEEALPFRSSKFISLLLLLLHNYSSRRLASIVCWLFVDLFGILLASDLSPTCEWTHHHANKKPAQAQLRKTLVYLNPVLLLLVSHRS